MKKIFYTLIVLCTCFTGNSYADSWFSQDCNSCCDEPCCPEWSAEFRIGAFIPTNNKIRKAYSSAWADYQIQIGKRFCNDWQIFAEFSGSEKNGHWCKEFAGTVTRYKSKLHMYPISLGLKYFYNICENFDVYVGAGAVYTFFRLKQSSPYQYHRISKGQYGGVIKTGAVYTFCNSWFIDIFADYIFQRLRYTPITEDPFSSRRTLKFNGFKIGGGIGYNF